MLNQHTKNLIIEYLEFSEEAFAVYLEDFHQIEPTEAGVIIDELKSVIPFSIGNRPENSDPGEQISSITLDGDYLPPTIQKDLADMLPEKVFEMLKPKWPKTPSVETIKTWSRHLTREAVRWAIGKRETKPDYFRIYER